MLLSHKKNLHFPFGGMKQIPFYLQITIDWIILLLIVNFDEEVIMTGPGTKKILSFKLAEMKRRDDVHVSIQFQTVATESNFSARF